MADGKSGLSPSIYSPQVLAREIELQVSATHIQWRYVGDTAWTNLIALSEITGADGAPGPAGADGAPGVVQAVIAGTNVTVDATDPANPIVSATGGGGSSISVEDEGTPLTGAVTKFNFVGAGVTVTEPVADEVTVTILGTDTNTTDLVVQDEGGTIVTTDQINFVGAGVTVTEDPVGVAKVTIAGGGGSAIAVSDEGTPLTAAVASFDFVGNGVVATESTPDNVVVTINFTDTNTTDLVVQDEGGTIVTTDQINFVGAGVVVTEDPAGVAKVTIAGGGGSAITVSDEGTPLTTALASLNFVGAGVTVTEPTADNLTVTIPGGGGTVNGSAAQLASNDLLPIALFDSPTWASGLDITQDATIYWPVYIDSDITVDGVSMYVNLSNATPTISFSLYEFLGAGKPGAAVIAVDIPVSTTGQKDVAVTPVALSQGWYFAAVHRTGTGAIGFWGNSTSGTEGNVQLISLAVSDPWSLLTSATEVHSRRFADTLMPGSNFNLGEDLTGTVLTAANTTTDARVPFVFLIKQ